MRRAGEPSNGRASFLNSQRPWTKLQPLLQQHQEADTELQSCTLKGRHRPDIAHLFDLSPGQQEQQTERSRLSPELQKRTDARGVLPLTTAAGMDFK